MKEKKREEERERERVCFLGDSPPLLSAPHMSIPSMLPSAPGSPPAARYRVGSQSWGHESCSPRKVDPIMFFVFFNQFYFNFGKSVLVKRRLEVFSALIMFAQVDIKYD